MNNTTAHRSCEAGDGQQQEQVVHGLVAAGLLASAAGQLMVTAGLLCIARSSKPGERHWAKFKAIGIAAIVLNGTLIDSLCYAVTPISLSAPLTLLVLVFSQIFVRNGWIVEKQTISVATTLSIGVVCGGILITIIFGPKCTRTPPMAEMRALAARPPFAGFALGSLVVIVSTVLPRRVLRGPRHRLLRALWYGLGSTLSGGLANLGLKIVSIGVRVSLEGDVQVCRRRPPRARGARLRSAWPPPSEPAPDPAARHAPPPCRRASSPTRRCTASCSARRCWRCRW